MEQKKGIDYAALRLSDMLPQSELTVGEMIARFRQAKDRRAQLQALAELNVCKVDDIKEMLLANGVKPQEFPRAPRKRHPVEIQPEDQERLKQPDPTPAPAEKPAQKTETAPPKKINRSKQTPGSRSCGSCPGRSSGTSPKSGPTGTGNTRTRIPGGVWSLIATSTPCCGT